MPSIVDFLNEQKAKKDRLPALPDIGGGSPPVLQDNAFLQRVQKLRPIAEKGKRLLIDRNFDPEITNMIGDAFPGLKKPIKDGRLNFHVEIPGVNSKRAFIGFKYTF